MQEAGLNHHRFGTNAVSSHQRAARWHHDDDIYVVVLSSSRGELALADAERRLPFDRTFHPTSLHAMPPERLNENFAGETGWMGAEVRDTGAACGGPVCLPLYSIMI